MKSHFTPLLYTFLILLCCTLIYAIPTVQLNANSNGSYVILVNGATWFVSANTWFRGNGQTYSAADGTLVLQAFQKEANSSNSVGLFNQYLYTYTSKDNTLTWSVVISAYYALAIEDNFYDDPSNIRALTFSQTYITGANNTQSEEQNVLSSFPSFDISSSQLTSNLGYLSFCGIFLSSNFGKYSGNNANMELCSNGLESGPLVIFDEHLTAIISPVAQFMVTSIVQNKNSIDVGFMGGITNIPSYTATESIIYFGDRGLTETLLTWGDILLNVYGKVRENIYTEFTTQYLGYNTDNGAYYYYNTVPNTTYEDTLYQVKDYAKSEELPYRYMWLDSWWYFKDHGPNGGGVVNWTAMPSVFPSGLVDLHTQLEWPFIAHNRFWSPNTTYATQNGGDYNFIIEEQFSVPNDQMFWDDLMSTAAAWGVRIYEQDWLITEFENMKALKDNVHLARTWLRQMGAGAQKHGINIQYCMPLPRQALESLEIPNVVQIRASGDYNPNTDQWKIGVSSLIDYAIGLAPFKDDFWTTTDQPGNPYHNSEPAPMIEAVVATLSTGPVTPSDGIGYANSTIIAHTCRTDGLLLKPDRPAFLIDRAFYFRALQSTGPDGEVMHTFTRYPVGTWHIVLSADLKSEFDFTSVDLNSNEKYFAFEMDSLGNFPVNFQTFDPVTPLNLVPNTKETFSLFHFAPVLRNGMILIGEAGKFVKMSKQRISEVVVINEITLATVRGSAGEFVTLEYFESQISTSVSYAQCQCDDSGNVMILLTQDNGFQCLYT